MPASFGPQTVGKVVVVGGGPLARHAARGRFQTIPGFQPEGDPPGGFGTIGRITMGEGVRVDVAELPGDPQHRPLWRPFAAGAVGAVVLLPADDAEPLLAELSKVLKLPIVVCGPKDAAVPAPLRDARGVALGGSDAAEGLRALLAGAGVRGAA